MTDTLNMRQLQDEIIAGRYYLERYLSEGGFGVVYQARHFAYGESLREVAIKIAKRPMSDTEARRIFRDALLMSSVAENASDAILRDRFVTVYDAGRCEGGKLAGHPYLVMEYVPGGSLSHVLRAGPFPLTRTLAYFDQIVQAVAFMHSGYSKDGKHVPIVHRDIKPDNILVVRRKDSGDTVKLTDFGLAIEVDTLLGWVESGGDLAYLAPESFSRNLSSPQSDVYMLGLTFHEMLTGVNPFDEVGHHLRGSDQEKQEELRRLHLTARQMEQFKRLEENIELAQRPALLRVIRTALALDMESRTYRNAQEFQAAWERAKQEDVPILPPDVKPWEHVRQLTDQAEQCLAVHDLVRGEVLLRQALKINLDRNLVPDHMLVGRTCLLMVRLLIKQDNFEEAGRLANDSYQRRRCRSTCLAMAEYYEKQQSPLTALFEREAASCRDQE